MGRISKRKIRGTIEKQIREMEKDHREVLYVKSDHGCAAAGGFFEIHNDPDGYRVYLIDAQYDIYYKAYYPRGARSSGAIFRSKDVSEIINFMKDYIDYEAYQKKLLPLEEE